MTVTPTCEALRDDIIALLYEEGDPAERSRARDHLALCLPCRAEYSELKSVRTVLSGWSLPAATPLKPSSAASRWLAPGLAAAAGLILGLGLAAAGRSTLFPSPDPTASDATTTSASSLPPSSRNAANFVSDDRLQQALRAQESRFQAEIADLRRSLILASEAPASSNLAAPAQARPASNSSPAPIERLLKASEERQLRLIEERLASLKTETDLQRQYDLAQIAAGLAYIDSRAGADAARTSELMKNLVRVTAKPQDR